MASRAYKAANLSYMPPWASAFFMDVSFSTLVREGVKSNSAVFACLSALTSGFIEAPLHVLDMDGNILVNHPISRLFASPNPDIPQTRFQKLLMSYAAISGNAYTWVRRNEFGQPLDLWPLSDMYLTPVASTDTSNGFISHYELKVDGQTKRLEKTDIIHQIWEPDPERPERGYGALQAAARDTDVDNEVSYYAYRLLKNDAIPRIVVNLVPGEDFDEAKASRLRRQWIDKYGGEGRGGPAFLEAGMTTTVLGLNMQDLAWDALRKLPESRISASFKVPAIVAGLSVGLDQSTYANYAEAREAMTEDTLIPIWILWQGTYQHFFKRDYPDVQIVFNTSTVRSLQKDETTIWTRVTVAWQAGIITRADARRAMKLPVSANDEVYKVGMSDSFVNFDQDMTEVNLLDEPEPAKSLDDGETKVDEDKSIANSRRIARSFVSLRRGYISPFASDLDGYFEDLSDLVWSRFVKYYDPGKDSDVLAAEKRDIMLMEVKAIPSPEVLITPEEEAALLKIYKRYYLQIMEATWPKMTASIGFDIAFDINNPAVVRQLSKAGVRVKGITETTREALGKVLKYGYENGWSVAQFRNGIEGQPGITSVVSETYKNRSLTIARTELGETQNGMTIDQYGTWGVKELFIMDDGLLDSHETCRWIAGQIRPMEWASRSHPTEGPAGVQNPLQHPNCLRTFAPYFKPGR